MTVVYFVQAGGADRPIKIGCARCVKSRVHSLQGSSPDILVVLGAVPGDMRLEKALHVRLRPFRVRGEWFAPAPEVLAAISELRRAASPADAAPLASTTELLSEVEAFLERSGMADSTFGRGAVNDWKFVRDLRGGSRRVWPETAAKVRAFIAAQSQPVERSESAAA